MVNKAFIEIMTEGDANGRGFQYPIPTYSITRDFDWSPTENNKLLFELTAKYGTPYFSNYINSDMEPSDVRSMLSLIHIFLFFYLGPGCLPLFVHQLIDFVTGHHHITGLGLGRPLLLGCGSGGLFGSRSLGDVYRRQAQ